MTNEQMEKEVKRMEKALDNLINSCFDTLVPSLMETINKAIPTEPTEESNDSLEGAIWATISKISQRKVFALSQKVTQHIKKKLTENPDNVPEMIKQAMATLKEIVPKDNDEDEYIIKPTTTQVGEA